jgi:hypothetical protein
MNVRGVVPTNMVSLTPTSGWLRVDAHEFVTISKQSRDNSDHTDKKENDWGLTGYLAPEVQMVRALLGIAFEAD